MARYINNILSEFFREGRNFNCYSLYRNYPIYQLRRSKRNSKKIYFKQLDGYGKPLVTYIMYLKTPINNETLEAHGRVINGNVPKRHFTDIKYSQTMKLEISHESQYIPQIGMCDLTLKLQPRIDNLDLLASILYIPINKQSH